MKKTVYRVLVCAVSMMLLFCSASLAESAVDVIMNAGTAQAFTDEAVPEKDLKTILNAGLIAPSALNLQPWYFSVVTDPKVMKEIAGSETSDPVADKSAGPHNADIGDSPVAVVIYSDGSVSSPVADFDCGLAAQNMYIAAASLGYGVKYVSSPTATLNGDRHDELCEKLGVPAGSKAITVLLIGKKDGTVDSATGASVRDPMEKKVSFIK